MELTHLKAAAQLAEMEHKADPKNVGKKDAFEKAQAEYEQAAEAQAPADTAEPVSDKTSQDTTEQRRLLGLFEEAGAISIEELEEMLKAKKAEKKAADDQAKAEKKAAEDKEKADKKAADDQAKADKEKADKEAEDAKKNENQS